MRPTMPTAIEDVLHTVPAVGAVVWRMAPCCRGDGGVGGTGEGVMPCRPEAFWFLHFMFKRSEFLRKAAEVFNQPAPGLVQLGMLRVASGQEA